MPTTSITITAPPQGAMTRPDFKLYTRQPLAEITVPRDAAHDSGTHLYIAAMVALREFSYTPTEEHVHEQRNAWYAVRTRANGKVPRF